MKLRYTRLALADLEQADAFIRAENPGAAQTAMARIRGAIGRLVAFPDSGRPGRVPGTRELIVPNTPFVVAYRVTPGTVDVLAVIHASRRWPASFG
jgi:addiction module RelE/StbE family toxin